MNTGELKKITENLIETFNTAGQESIDLYKKGLKIKIKEDKSPVSNGDLRTNELITKKIIELTPNIPIVSEESVDYPEFGHAVGNSVKDGESAKGIVVCGSGIGISMAANKVEGIRAALCTTPEHALMSRLHNDANVLAIGARMTDFDIILEIVDTWLSSEFEGGRHSRRVNKIEVS